MNRIFRPITLAVTLLVCLAANAAQKPPSLNVLFIAADDMRPQLGCYGHENMITPNLDRLAGQGTVFHRAYCQAAVCRASRLSLLTGRRPDTTRIHTNGGPLFRTRNPNWVTLPQHFKNNGYQSISLGKIFHGAFAVRKTWNDPKSWSRPEWWPGPRYYYTPEGVAAAKQVFAGSAAGKKAPLDDWVNHFVLGPSWEAPDVADNVLYDGQVADKAIATLRELRDQPFFLAVGFLKPHLPFIAPKKYWDMYPAEEVVVADNQHPPKDSPKYAGTTWGHPRSYSDVPKKGPMPKELVPKLTRGYAACVTYVDAQVGRVLAELDRLGLRDNTLVVFWGDHGFHLGENDVWGKATNFELSTHVPLIVSAPQAKAKGRPSRALVELVDLYPTLCELSGLPVLNELEGKSLAPLLNDPELPWKQAAFSQYPREKVMGRSMRTDRWRFTQWTENGKTVAVELYDQQNDPKENINLANLPDYAGQVRKLTAKIKADWPKQR